MNFHLKFSPVALSVAISSAAPAAVINTLEFRNDLFAANGRTQISPTAPAVSGLPGSNIHGYAFRPGVATSQLYAGTGSGPLDYGVRIAAAGGVTGGAFNATTYNGQPTSYSVGYATIYDTEIAALSNRNGGDPDLQRVERAGGINAVNGAIIRNVWGRTPSGTAAALGVGIDRGNLATANPSQVVYGALIAQQTGPTSGNPTFNSNGFITSSPNDVAGGTIIFEIVNPALFNYRSVGFDFVDFDEIQGTQDVVIFIETTDGFVRRFSVADGDVDNGIPLDEFGSEVDAGLSRVDPININSTGNGFAVGSANQGSANGDVTPSGTISRVIVDYQNVSGAIGRIQFSDAIPEPSAVFLSILASTLLMARRRS